MVQHGAFKLELVDPATEIPFLEHTGKNGNTYVEAEPKAEYLIRFQKTQATWEHIRHLYIEFYVDGKFLGFYLQLERESVITSGRLYGPMDFVDGSEVTHALKFVIPSLQFTNEEFSVDRFIQTMGRVEVKIYEGLPCVATTSRNSYSNFNGADALLSISRQGSEKEKAVLSARGATKVTTKHPWPKTESRRGTLLDTITLRYCSVTGLQLVEALPKQITGEMLWDRARRKAAATPSPPGKRYRYADEIVNIGQRLVHEITRINMVNDDSHDDDDADDDDEY